MTREEFELKRSIIVTSSGSLIALAVAQALHALLASDLPVIVPDMVRLDVIREIDKPGAREVADWIRANDPYGVRIASTEVYEEFEVLRGVNPGARSNGREKRAAAEALSKELAQQRRGAILLFEDSMDRKSNFLRRLPAEVVVTSSSELVAVIAA